MGIFLAIGGLFVLLGLGLPVAAVLCWLKGARDAARTVPATGRVLSVVRRRRVYVPIVEFLAPNGQLVQFESPWGTQPASHAVGDAIAVRFDPANPDAAYVESALGTWLLPGILGGLGCAFLFMGAVFVGMGLLVRG